MGAFWNDLLNRVASQQGEKGSAFPVSSLKRAWRDDFPGTALNPANWTVVQTGAGQTIGVSGSNLTIATGTTINSETIIQSVAAYPIPVRVGFLVTLSQRITNQEFILELVNAAGNMATRIILEGTTATTMIFHTVHDNTIATSTITNTAPTSSLVVKEIELAPDMAFVYSKWANGTGRSAIGARDTQLPDPNELYFIRLRIRNLAVAPASSTTLAVDSVFILDMTAISVDLLTARGETLAHRAFPVNIAGGFLPVVTTGNMQSINTAFADTSATLGANAIFNGTARDFTTSQRTNRFRAASTSDQTGTLFIEQSNDGTAWVMTHSQATASITDADATARHIAVLDVPVVNRFARVRYRNGATLQTAFRLISMQGGI